MNGFKQRRLELGLTQRQVAAACHTSPSRISDYERGRRPVPRDTLPRLLAVLKLPAHLTLSKLPRELARRHQLAVPLSLPTVPSESWRRLPHVHPQLVRALTNLPDLSLLSGVFRADCVDECVAIAILIDAGGKPYRANPHALGFRRHPIVTEQLEALGDRELPCLRLEWPGLSVILWPQVTLRLAEFTCRLDYLALVESQHRACWGYIELDGNRHDGRWDERRHRELRMPALRLTRSQVLGPQLLVELERGLSGWCQSTLPQPHSA